MGEQKTALTLILILCLALSALPLVKATEDSWTILEPMPTARSYPGVAVVDGKIYAIGGSTLHGWPINVNEIYDPETDTWTVGTLMPTLRREFGVAVINDELYLIGGYDNSHTPFAVNEKYTPIGYIPEFPSWTILPLILTVTLFAMIVKRKLGNVNVMRARTRIQYRNLTGWMRSDEKVSEVV